MGSLGQAVHPCHCELLLGFLMMEDFSTKWFHTGQRLVGAAVTLCTSPGIIVYGSSDLSVLSNLREYSMLLAVKILHQQTDPAFIITL